MAATAVQTAPGEAPPPPPAGPTATSAAGLLALLAEPDPALAAAALRGLDACVPSFWFEIAQSVNLVEAKADDPGFEHRELAALVASKVRVNGEGASSFIFLCGGRAIEMGPPLEASPTRRHHAHTHTHTQVFYHLGELDDALTYALAAGSLFDVDDGGDFTQAVLGEFPLFCFRSAGQRRSVSVAGGKGRGVGGPCVPPDKPTRC